MEALDMLTVLFGFELGKKQGVFPDMENDFKVANPEEVLQLVLGRRRDAND